MSRPGGQTCRVSGESLEIRCLVWCAIGNMHIFRTQVADFRRSAQYSGSDVKIEFDEFVVDTAQYTLTRDGDPVGVEPMVFDLLLHFVRHPGQGFQRGRVEECHLAGPDRIGRHDFSRIKECAPGAGRQWLRPALYSNHPWPRFPLFRRPVTASRPDGGASDRREHPHS